MFEKRGVLLLDVLTLGYCELKEYVSTQTYTITPQYNPCITVNNGGLKASSQLSVRGRLCLAEMAWLGMAPKEIFLTYLIHFVFLIIRFAPGYVIMVVCIIFYCI